MAVTDQAARIAPYVEQLLDDDEVRENVRRGVDATRQAYERARDKKRASQALKDRKVQRRVRDAMQAAGEVVGRVARRPKERKRARRGRTLAILALGGAGLAAALNPKAWRKGLALLGGKQEAGPDMVPPIDEAPGTSA